MTEGTEKDRLYSLVAQSTQQLTIRSSIVGRGLQELSEHLRGAAVQAAQDQSFQLFKLGQIEAAIAACGAGLEIAPTDEILWQIKGVCLAKQNRHAEGLECIDRALEFDPTNPYCWALKCHLLKTLHRTEECLTCWRRVITISHDFQGAWREIGCCLLELRRFSEAIEAFDSELKLNYLDTECLSKRDFARQELERHPQDTPGNRDAEAIDWSQPTIILTIIHWYVEPMEHSPGVRCFNFVFEAENIADSPQRLGKEISLFHRSRATGKLSLVGDAILLPFSPELDLPPQSAASGFNLELVLACSESKSSEDCVREILGDSSDLLAYDSKFGTVILLSAHESFSTSFSE